MGVKLQLILLLCLTNLLFVCLFLVVVVDDDVVQMGHQIF